MLPGILPGLLAGLLLLPMLPAAAQTKPNVIYILADDLGRGMLSFYGQKIVHTPHIDAIARQGVRFNRAYAGVYCAPSRASFITGYSDCRPGKYVLTNAGIYSQLAAGKLTDAQVQAKVDSVIGQEPDITYLPQIFKKAGYVTGQIGKLEYGFATSARQMARHGWDYHFGYYDHAQCHGFYPAFLHENGRLVRIPGNTRADAGKTPEYGGEKDEPERWNMQGKTVYSQDIFLDKIRAFIRRHKHEPFFLYHPTQLPHGPASIPAIYPEFAMNDSLTQIEKVYASMVKKLDEQVGLIVEEVKAQGLEKNTIIVFSSDNGHELYYAVKGRVEKPYRNMQTGALYDNVTGKFYSGPGGDVFNGNNSMAGLKRSNWEGGARVPLFISWPGRFRQNADAGQLVGNYDFMATMADLLKVTPADKKDGVSFLPALTGGQAKRQHEAVAIASPMGPALITANGWKLRYFAPRDIFQLYDLNNDPAEQHDLAARFPDKVQQLRQMLTEKCAGDLSNGWFRDNLVIRPVR